MKGKVYLVGAGPGDPGLITVKGLECIRCSDAIIYDHLVSTLLLKHARKDSEIIYVGKKGGFHVVPQEKINQLIVEKAQSGKTVTRLKGGDPFIFGRGGEETEVLTEAGISFEIVPGVTSAIAVPAYAGIPLTHRKFTSTLAFVTGHEDPNKGGSSIDWGALAKGIGTIVFFMGVKNLPNITRNLVQHGLPSDTPVAVIQWGTTPRQVTVTGTLETVAKRVEAAGIRPPAIIVVGRVAGLRERLKWFEDRPLLGKQIVVTRASDQAGELLKRLTDLGAECFECPTIQTFPPDDKEPVKKALKSLSNYDWIIFTSVNGVNYFFDALFEKGQDVRALHRVNTAVIGSATQKRLSEFGINSDIVPESYRAESVIEAFKPVDLTGKRILLPRAKEARPVLPAELAKMGAVVDDVPTYCTKAVKNDADLLISRLEQGTVDAITFTSSSTAKNFKRLLPADRFETLMHNVAIASIGPITAETAENLGFEVRIHAETYTIPGLCEAIVKYFNQ